MIEQVIKRLSEPSTYAGLMGLALILGANTEQFEVYAAAAAGFFGFVAIVVGEKGDA